jgi:hypothetical protein
VEDHPELLDRLGEHGAELDVVHPVLVRQMEGAARLGRHVRHPVAQGRDFDLVRPLAHLAGIGGHTAEIDFVPFIQGHDQGAAGVVVHGKTGLGF